MTFSLPLIEQAHVPLLRGDCHRCGSCCVVESEGVEYTCTLLEITGRLGEPHATRCSVYFARTHWMPINMVAQDGRMIHANCAAHGTEAETLAIIRNGVGKGCGLEIVA